MFPLNKRVLRKHDHTRLHGLADRDSPGGSFQAGFSLSVVQSAGWMEAMGGRPGIVMMDSNSEHPHPIPDIGFVVIVTGRHPSGLGSDQPRLKLRRVESYVDFR